MADGPPLEAIAGPLRQSRDQTELLLRSLQQNLTYDSFEDPMAAAGPAAAEEDWSYTEERFWHNVPSVMKRAIATLGRQMTLETNIVLEVLGKTDAAHARLSRIEDTLCTVQKGFEALTAKIGESDSRLLRLEASQRAQQEQTDVDFTSLRRSHEKLAEELRMLNNKQKVVDRLEGTMERVIMQVDEIRQDEIPAVKDRIDNVKAYESGLRSLVEQVRELQETSINQRYAAAAASGIPTGGLPPSRMRSTGRWIWEGRRVLNSRSKLVQWDSRSQEVGDAFRWSPDDKRYVIEVRRGGLYKLAVGAFTTEKAMTDMLMLYIDDDALLSPVHSTSFVAHGTSNVAGSGQVKRIGGGRNRVSGKGCCAADCTVSCFTGLSSTEYIFLPSRALLCVRCTVEPTDIVCGFLELEEFA